MTPASSVAVEHAVFPTVAFDAHEFDCCVYLLQVGWGKGGGAGVGQLHRWFVEDMRTAGTTIATLQSKCHGSIFVPRLSARFYAHHAAGTNLYQPHCVFCPKEDNLYREAGTNLSQLCDVRRNVTVVGLKLSHDIYSVKLVKSFQIICVNAKMSCDNCKLCKWRKIF